MKQLLLLLSVAATLLTSCSGDQEATPANTTSLELTLKDEDGNIITNNLGFATLYSTVDDWSYDRNRIGEPAFADANGKIQFTGLSAQKYYWRVENGCRNNYTTSITTPLPLEANTTNRVEVPLTTNFTLRLKKSAAYETATFMVYVNNSSVLTIPSGPDVRDILNMPPHSTIRVVQTGVFTGPPIDVTYSNLDEDCGQMLTLEYPN